MKKPPDESGAFALLGRPNYQTGGGGGVTGGGGATGPGGGDGGGGEIGLPYWSTPSKFGPLGLSRDSRASRFRRIGSSENFAEAIFLGRPQQVVDNIVATPNLVN